MSTSDRVKPSALTMIDPVCGMAVGANDLRAEGYDEIAFCSELCLQTFSVATEKSGPWTPRSGALPNAAGD